MSMAATAVVKLGPGIIQHCLIDIDPEAAGVEVGKELENPTGTRPEIDKKFGLHFCQGIAHRVFDDRLIDIQGSEMIPIGRMSLKIGLCCRRPVVRQRLQALAVAPKQRVRWIETSGN